MHDRSLTALYMRPKLELSSEKRELEVDPEL
jgi:hypothetical protein